MIKNIIKKYNTYRLLKLFNGKINKSLEEKDYYSLLKNCNFKIKDNNGKNVLMYLLENNDFFKIDKDFILFHLDDDQLSQKDNEDKTILEYIIKNENNLSLTKEELFSLIKRSNINIVNKEGFNLLMMILTKNNNKSKINLNNDEIYEILIENDLTAVDSYQENILNYIIKYSDNLKLKEEQIIKIINYYFNMAFKYILKDNDFDIEDKKIINFIHVKQLEKEINNFLILIKNLNQFNLKNDQIFKLFMSINLKVKKTYEPFRVHYGNRYDTLMFLLMKNKGLKLLENKQILELLKDHLQSIKVNVVEAKKRENYKDMNIVLISYDMMELEIEEEYVSELFIEIFKNRKELNFKNENLKELYDFINQRKNIELILFKNIHNDIRLMKDILKVLIIDLNIDIAKDTKEKIFQDNHKLFNNDFINTLKILEVEKMQTLLEQSLVRKEQNKAKMKI